VRRARPAHGLPAALTGTRQDDDVAANSQGGAEPGAEMPFLDHLEELRQRLFWIIGALLVGVVVAFVVLQKIEIINFLQQPVAPYLNGRKLVITHPADAFKIVLNASFVLGLVLASPVVIYQAWAFFGPALYPHEKRLVVPVGIGAVALFIAGVALAFYVVLPFTLGFLLTFQSDALEPMITASEFFGFEIAMSLTFGVVFELPILIIALTALGLVTPQFLNKYRRHAIVLCVVGAAFITPGADPTSLFALAIPLYFLFELSVVLSGLVYRRRLRREAAREAEAAASAVPAPAPFADHAHPDDYAPTRLLTEEPAPDPDESGVA
jgi:sec-independent protein translocase protein TatC